MFVTFAVVLVTVVGQGLTLPVLIRRLGVAADGREEEHEELVARLTASKAALTELDVMADEGWAGEEPLDRARQYYEQRKRRFAARAGKIEDDGYEERVDDPASRSCGVSTEPSGRRSSSSATPGTSATR